MQTTEGESFGKCTKPVGKDSIRSKSGANQEHSQNFCVMETSCLMSETPQDWMSQSARWETVESWNGGIKQPVFSLYLFLTFGIILNSEKSFLGNEVFPYTILIIFSVNILCSHSTLPNMETLTLLLFYYLNYSNPSFSVRNAVQDPCWISETSDFTKPCNFMPFPS